MPLWTTEPSSLTYEMSSQPMGGVKMLHAARIALIETLQALLAEEQAMIKKLRDRSIELDIEHFAAQLDDTMEW
jgi:hypothetical protein